MNQVFFDQKDEIMIRLLHYFITEHSYNPVVLHGAKDEIWLENLTSEYQIIRISTKYIHNDEQLENDILKTRHVMKNIKRKVFSIHMKAINILVNMGDNVTFTNHEVHGNITCIGLKELSDLQEENALVTTFPTISKTIDYKEEGVELFMKLTKDINEKNEKSAAQAEDIFKPKFPIVTYAIMTINAILFLGMYLYGSGSTHVGTLMSFGASRLYEIVELGQYHRLLTNAFLHIGIVHFLFNSYALYIIGPQLEGFFGKMKFLAIYLGSAIIGNLLSLVFFTEGSVGAGASGAIFGLLGSLLYFGYYHRVYLGSVLKSQVIPLILLNLLFGFMIPGIDNAAHIGGLIAGVLLSMAVGIKYKTTQTDRINGIILTTIFVIFLSYLVFFS